jgi:serine/threonine protein kinase
MQTIISNKYILLEKIGNGSFGQIFKGENIRTKEKVAIKMCAVDNPYNLLKNEAKVYQLIGSIAGFPHLKWFGVENDMQYLVINLLGVSLSHFKKENGRISITFAAIIGIQMISRLQVFHNLGLIHRDIKPDNFVFGLNNNFNLIYLIDYGFSIGYKNSGENTKVSDIIGTINYISLNVHKKYEPSRRDDLESVCYVLLYLLDLMSWERFKDSSIQNMERIILEKENIYLDKEVPFFIRIILQYIRNLSVDAEPNYDWIISQMTY